MVYGLAETEKIVNKIVYNGQCKLAIFFLIEKLLWMPTHSVRKCCVRCSYALQGINMHSKASIRKSSDYPLYIT